MKEQPTDPVTIPPAAVNFTKVIAFVKELLSAGKAGSEAAASKIEADWHNYNERWKSEAIQERYCRRCCAYVLEMRPLTTISKSVVVKRSSCRSASIRTLERMGRVWRRSMMPETALRGSSNVSLFILIVFIIFS